MRTGPSSFDIISRRVGRYRYGADRRRGCVAAELPRLAICQPANSNYRSPRAPAEQLLKSPLSSFRRRPKSERAMFCRAGCNLPLVGDANGRNCETSPRRRPTARIRIEHSPQDHGAALGNRHQFDRRLVRGNGHVIFLEQSRATADGPDHSVVIAFWQPRKSGAPQLLIYGATEPKKTIRGFAATHCLNVATGPAR